MTNFIITNDKIEIGDIVAYQDVKHGKNHKSKKIWVLGLWCEWFNETIGKFQYRVKCVDNEQTTLYNKKWIKKVKLL